MRTAQTPAPDVLLIEGAWHFRALITAQLMELGYEVLRLHTIRAGIELLDLLEEARPRLIVVDTVGQERVQAELPHLRAVARGIPVVLCTGPYDEAALDIDRADWAAVLIRPFTVGDLAETVTDLLRDRGRLHAQ